MANPILGSGGLTGGIDSSYDPSQEQRRQPDAGSSGGGMNPTSQTAGTVGTGDLAGPHNLPLHVAGLIIIGLAVIYGMQAAGFRAMVTAGVGRA